MKMLSEPQTSLVLIDFQTRLMPAIAGGNTVIRNAQRLLNAATIFQLPTFITEQNPKGLGSTVPELNAPNAVVIDKMSFNACAEGRLIPLVLQRTQVVVCGCEAHVCVLQTVLALLNAGLQVYVVRDAIGSRSLESKEAAIQRMSRHGAEIIDTEMAVFEWLGSAEHPHFRSVVALIK